MLFGSGLRMIVSEWYELVFDGEIAADAIAIAVLVFEQGSEIIFRIHMIITSKAWHFRILAIPELELIVAGSMMAEFVDRQELVVVLVDSFGSQFVDIAVEFVEHSDFVGIVPVTSSLQ